MIIVSGECSGAHGGGHFIEAKGRLSVVLPEIAAVSWNNDNRVACRLWLKGNNTMFHFEPKSDDRIDTGMLESEYSEELQSMIPKSVRRSSLEILRTRFP